MTDNFPNNVFIYDDLQKQIDTIKEYTKSFKKKHADIFKDDTDDTYIDFNWTSFPVNKGGKSNISFNVTFSDKLPVNAKNEFENYLKQFMASVNPASS